MTDYEEAIRSKLASREREAWNDYLNENSERLNEAQQTAAEVVDEMFYGMAASIPEASEDDIDELLDEDPEFELLYEQLRSMITGQYSHQNLVEEAGDVYETTPEAKEQEIQLQLGAAGLDAIDTEDLVATYEQATEEVEALVEVAEEEGLEEATEESTIKDVRREVRGSAEEYREQYEGRKETTAELFEQVGAALAQEPGLDQDELTESLDGVRQGLIDAYETLVDPKIEQEIEELYGGE